MKVFLNPGHAPNGYPDPGAVNIYTGLKEAIVVKNVARLVEKYLTAAGVEVVGNLQDDSLAAIYNASNRTDADIFVSIHANSGPMTANGTETYYWHNSYKGSQLAQCIQNQIVSAMDTEDRGIKKCVPGTNTNFAVVRMTDAVAVLVELAFISNADDEILLAENQDDFARAIARGITDYQALGGA